MTKQEFNQYLLDNQAEIVNAMAAKFESGVNSGTLEMAGWAHEKMIDLVEEGYNEDEEFELSQLDNLMYDAMKELGYFVKSGNSIADRMARYHEDRNERYNPDTKQFEKY